MINNIDLTVHPEALKRTVERAREKQIRIPTFKQMRDPKQIPAGIVKALQGVGLWDVNPLNLYRITGHNQPVENGGGFGGNGNWIWILFLWLIWGWGGNGNWGGNGANGFLSNQISNDSGRELLMNAIQGNSTAIQNLANLLNTEVNTVQNGIFTLNNAITSVGTQVGMSGLQI